MMELADVRYVIAWTLRFQHNLAPQDRELSPVELTKAAKDCVDAYDPHESAAEISEGVTRRRF